MPAAQRQSSEFESAQYAEMLAEASALRGTSLARDAARRLGSNYAAVAALCFLVALSVMAVVTPLLPLQSPQRQHLGSGPRNRQFLPPGLTTSQLEVDGPEGVISLRTAVQQHEHKVLQLQSRSSRAPQATRSALLLELEQAAHAHPYRRVWHNPHTWDRWLMGCRLAIFGDWCIPSILGTDHLGRDLLSRLLWGTRVSLSVGLTAAAVSLVIGVLYGATAGYLGGVVDAIMMRGVDVLNAIPFIFVVIFALTILGQEQVKEALTRYRIDRMVMFYLLIGAIYWLTMARVVRGQVMSLKQEAFIEAARVIGASRLRIIVRHLLPNVVSIVIVYLTLTIPSIVLFEAFLSFLGLGVEPPDVSWGILANDGIQAITPIRIYWWLVLFPGLTLAGTLLSLNYLGDGLRDALDPRFQRRY